MASPYTNSKWSDLPRLSPAEAREHLELIAGSGSVNRRDIVAGYASTHAADFAVFASGEFVAIVADIESAESSVQSTDRRQRCI